MGDRKVRERGPDAAPSPPGVAPLQGTPGHVPDLTTRFAVSIFLIGLTVLLVWIGGWPFRALVLLGAGIMLAEWAEMHRIPWPWTWFAVALLALVLLGGFEYFYPVGGADSVPVGYGEAMLAVGPETFLPLLYLAGAGAAGGLLLALVSRRPSLGWGFFYIGVPSAALLLMSWIDYAIVFWVMVVTWATDIGAFAAGKTIGGPKLAPSISPAKTWSGLIGGAVVAGLLGFLTALFFAFDDVVEVGSLEASWLFSLFLFMGAPMAIAAQMGDLYESWVKRRCGVKDSGTLLPGHGGVLDRCDGLIASVLLTTIMLAAGLWLW